jgi:hypothetical protein
MQKDGGVPAGGRTIVIEGSRVEFVMTNAEGGWCVILCYPLDPAPAAAVAAGCCKAIRACSVMRVSRVYCKDHAASIKPAQYSTQWLLCALHMRWQVWQAVRGQL